ncbi:serine-rich adhesin for platelets-like isoform X2 [Prorops nasuta]
MMAKRSLNRRSSRLSRISGFSTGILNPNSDVISNENPLWWKNLENETNIQSFNTSSIYNETSQLLNSNSELVKSTLNPPSNKRKWWELLENSNSAAQLQAKNKTSDRIMGTLNVMEGDSTDSEDLNIVKKGKALLRTRSKRKNRRNTFFKALNSSDTSESSKSSTKKVEKQVKMSSTDTPISLKRKSKQIIQEGVDLSSDDTNLILKPRHVLSHKNQKKKRNTLFTDALDQEDNTDIDTIRKLANSFKNKNLSENISEGNASKHNLEKTNIETRQDTRTHSMKLFLKNDKVNNLGSTSKLKNASFHNSKLSQENDEDTSSSNTSELKNADSHNSKVSQEYDKDTGSSSTSELKNADSHNSKVSQENYEDTSSSSTSELKNADSHNSKVSQKNDKDTSSSSTSELKNPDSHNSKVSQENDKDTSSISTSELKNADSHNSEFVKKSHKDSRSNSTSKLKSVSSHNWKLSEANDKDTSSDSISELINTDSDNEGSFSQAIVGALDNVKELKNATTNVSKSITTIQQSSQNKNKNSSETKRNLSSYSKEKSSSKISAVISNTDYNKINGDVKSPKRNLQKRLRPSTVGTVFNESHLSPDSIRRIKRVSLQKSITQNKEGAIKSNNITSEETHSLDLKLSASNSRFSSMPLVPENVDQQSAKHLNVKDLNNIKKLLKEITRTSNSANVTTWDNSPAKLNCSADKSLHISMRQSYKTSEQKSKTVSRNRSLERSKEGAELTNILTDEMDTEDEEEPKKRNVAKSPKHLLKSNSKRKFSNSVNIQGNDLNIDDSTFNKTNLNIDSKPIFNSTRRSVYYNKSLAQNDDNNKSKLMNEKVESHVNKTLSGRKSKNSKIGQQSTSSLLEKLPLFDKEKATFTETTKKSRKMSSTCYSIKEIEEKTMKEDTKNLNSQKFDNGTTLAKSNDELDTNRTSSDKANISSSTEFSLNSSSKNKTKSLQKTRRESIIQSVQEEGIADNSEEGAGNTVISTKDDCHYLSLESNKKPFRHVRENDNTEVSNYTNIGYSRNKSVRNIIGERIESPQQSSKSNRNVNLMPSSILDNTEKSTDFKKINSSKGSKNKTYTNKNDCLSRTARSIYEDKDSSKSKISEVEGGQMFKPKKLSAKAATRSISQKITKYFSKSSIDGAKVTELAESELNHFGDKFKEIQEKKKEIEEKMAVFEKNRGEANKRTSLKDTKIIRPKIELNRAKKPNKNSTKKVDKAYLVNGKVYKAPKLPRPKPWVTDRLYRYLWKCMKTKFKIGIKLQSEQVINKLSTLVATVTGCKKYDDYKNDLDDIINLMAQLGIIHTKYDFYMFCFDFLPYEFRKKVVPMLFPGNKLNVPFDSKEAYKTILKE